MNLLSLSFRHKADPSTSDSEKEELLQEVDDLKANNVYYDFLEGVVKEGEV